VFGTSRKATLFTARQDSDNDPRPSLLPINSEFQHTLTRSAQLLRTCKPILDETRPILYDKTTLHTISYAFAGKLPTRLSNDHPAMLHVKNLIWQMDCDILKHFYPEDFAFDAASLAGLRCLEIRVKSEMWRNGFLGNWCDRECLVKGRQTCIE